MPEDERTLSPNQIESFDKDRKKDQFAQTIIHQGMNDDIFENIDTKFCSGSQSIKPNSTSQK